MDSRSPRNCMFTPGLKSAFSESRPSAGVSRPSVLRFQLAFCATLRTARTNASICGTLPASPKGPLFKEGALEPEMRIPAAPPPRGYFPFQLWWKKMSLQNDSGTEQASLLQFTQRVVILSALPHASGFCSVLFCFFS